MIFKTFKDKIFPLKNPANYPDYVSEKDTLTSSSDLSRHTPDLSISSSPKDAIAASSKSSPDLSKSISPRSSLDLLKSSDNEESEDKIPDISSSEQTTMPDKFYGPDLISKYFKEKSLIEILNQLKSYRKNPKTFQEYNNLMTHLIIGLRKLDRDIKNTSEDEVKNKRSEKLLC